MADEEEIKLSFVADTSQVKAAEAATAKLGATFTDAAGRIRDARGRFVEMGSAAWITAKGLDGASEAAIQAAMNIGKASDATRTTTTAAGAAGGGMKGFGQTVQATGRIVQDFSAAGLNGIINNLEQVGMGLAQSAGKSAAFGAALGGAFQLSGVLLQLAMPHITKFLEAFAPEKLNPFQSAIEGIKEKIKGLEARPIKLAVDRLDLQNAEADLKAMTRALEEYNAVKGLRSKAEKESESAVRDAIAETPEGAAKVTAAVRANVVKDQMAGSNKIGEAEKRAKAAQADLDDAEKRGPEGFGGDFEAYASAVAGAKNRLGAANAEAASARFEITKEDGSADVATGDILGNAKPGQDVTAHQADMAKALARAGKGGLAKQVRSKSPARMQADAESDAADEAQQEYIEKSGKELSAASKAARERRKAEARRLAEGVQEFAERQVQTRGGYTTADLKRQFAKSGVTVDDDMVRAVFEIVRKEYAEKIRKRALEKNVSPAEAEKDLARDNQKDDAADARKDAALTPEQREKRAAAARSQAENRRNDKEILAANRPYMDGYTQLLMKGRRMGLTDTQADAATERSMAFDLRRTGQVKDPGKANAIAADAIADARRKFNAENGEGAKETAANTKATERLSETMDKVERTLSRGVTGVAG